MAIVFNIAQVYKCQFGGSEQEPPTSFTRTKTKKTEKTLKNEKEAGERQEDEN